jgi:cytochrome c-type biogenesis protein CcmH/NrfF
VVILLLGAFTLAVIVRRRRVTGIVDESSPLSADEQTRLDALLKKTPSTSDNNKTKEPKA